ncbi:MAG TPA: heavy metal-associated domain-containing protein [Bacteroidales bacterium]|nr:heavy metal-associated domain-containing protein [Bacteroidales bacterium]
MKSLKNFLAATLLVLATVAASAQDKSKNTDTVTFQTSIDCQNCVNNIMTNLPREKGVRDVKCNLKTKEVTVRYQKDKTSEETLKRDIEKLGYTAKPAEKKDSLSKKK